MFWFPDRDPEDALAPYDFPVWAEASSTKAIEEHIPVVGQVIYEGFPQRAS